jgi:SAM-dependent methyltransferase
VPYSQEFFDSHSRGASSSAAAVVPLLVELFQPTSVVDVGCGNGAWLRAFEDAGVSDYLGVDGYVDPSHLSIRPERFIEHDLTQPLELARRFDLALSLEVGEHLPAPAAPGYVSLLCTLASAVCFSAAIPFQGGTSHLNEQWPDYWCRLFADHSFEVVDCLRPQIWNDQRVEYWYRQNMLIFARPDVVGTLPRYPGPLRIVHPEHFLAVWRARHGTPLRRRLRQIVRRI